MERKSLITFRLRELFLDGTWIANTNYQAVLADLNFEVATLKIENLNTIARLVFHVNYYISGLNSAFATGILDIHDQFSFDLSDDFNESDWLQLNKEFIENIHSFIHHVDGLSDDELDSPFFQPQYGIYRRNIEAMIEHGYYHLGQISLIKKLIDGRNQEL